MPPLPPHPPTAAPPAAGNDDVARGRHGAQHALLFGLARNRRAWGLGLAALAVGVAVVALVIGLTDFTWAGLMAEWNRLIARIARLNPVAVIPLMALLPIAGFPISVVYLVAGARFGPWIGGLVVLFVTAVHLAGTYVIGRSFLRRPLARFIAARHRQLPEVPPDEQAAVAVIATLVPGPPYVVRNYLLVLAGVRLKIFFTVCLPIYVARSYVTILLGNLSGDPSRLGLAVLLAVDVLKVAICGVVIWRLREHHRRFHGGGVATDSVAVVPAPPSAGAR